MNELPSLCLDQIIKEEVEICLDSKKTELFKYSKANVLISLQWDDLNSDLILPIYNQIKEALNDNKLFGLK